MFGMIIAHTAFPLVLMFLSWMFGWIYEDTMKEAHEKREKLDLETRREIEETLRKLRC